MSRTGVQAGVHGRKIVKTRGGAFSFISKRSEELFPFFHRFAQIYALITISLSDIRFKWCFIIFFFCFQRVVLAMRVCTYSLRGCSRTLKTPNSPPLRTLQLSRLLPVGLYEGTGTHKQTITARQQSRQRSRQNRSQPDSRNDPTTQWRTFRPCVCPWCCSAGVFILSTSCEESRLCGATYVTCLFCHVIAIRMAHKSCFSIKHYRSC